MLCELECPLCKGRVGVPCKSPVARDLAEHTRFRGRGRLGSSQLIGTIEVLEAALSVALRPPELCEHRVDLGGPRTVPRRKQGRARLLEQLAALLVIGVEGCESEAKLQVRVLRCSLRPELERLAVEHDRGGVGAQVASVVACFRECHTGPRRQLARLLAGRARNLECRQVVMRDHLRVILGPAERFDPAGRPDVLLAAHQARDLGIGDVAQEQVEERVLRLVRDRRAPVPADELLALERVNLLFKSRRVRITERGDRARPEDLPDHGGVLEELFLERRQGVQPRADDSLDRLGQR